MQKVSTFLSGEVFSSKFHQILDTYFNIQENIVSISNKMIPIVIAHTLPSVLVSPTVRAKTKVAITEKEDDATQSKEEEEEEEEEKEEEDKTKIQT